MGTRSNTLVFNQGILLVNMYRQMDGYPSGHGQELYEFLAPIKLVNGLGLTENQRVANGMDCLAAQLVAHFKEEPGGIYLDVPNLDNCDNDYTYQILGDTFNPDEPLQIKVTTFGSHDNPIFEGTVEAFGKWIANGADDED